MRKLETYRVNMIRFLPESLIVVAFLFCGCVAKSPPKVKRALELELPSSYQSKLDVIDSDTNWIKEISKDGKLEKLIEEVLLNNWDFKKAATNVQRAAANAKISASKKYPKFSGGLGGARTERSFLGFPFGGDQESSEARPRVSKSLFSSYGMSLDMNWEIDLWGRMRAGQEALIAEFEASSSELRGFKSSLAGQTAKIWFALLGAKEQEELAKRSLASFKKTQRMLRDAFDAGNGAASQIRLAASDVEVAVALLEQRKAQVRAAARQLEILLGRYPGGIIEASGGLPRMPPPPPPGIPSDLLNRRTDIIAAERRLAAADRRIKEAKLALFPQISLTGSRGTTSEKLRDLTDSAFGVWNLGGQAGQQFFRAGEVLANVKLRQIMKTEAYIDYQSEVLEALREVETCLDNEVILRNRWNALVLAEDNLIEAYKRSVEEYRGGIGTSTNLLLTQRQMLSVSSQVLEMRRIRLENRINLHLTLGGNIKNKP
ncbi:MAG: efflux transporter outer membrane subunit [Verrucomicrobiales bacterium]